MKAWDIFYQNVSQNGFVMPGDKIILAVSGGMDSVCMLHLFWRFAKKVKIALLVVNFNHNLRKESVKEAEVVKGLSARRPSLTCLTKASLPSIYRHAYCPRPTKWSY